MSDTYQTREVVIQGMFLFAAILLIFKAMQLQIFDASIQNKAETSAIGKKVVYPSRGLIYDREGRLLTQNDPIFDLMVTYNQVDTKMDTAYFCEILGINKKTFKKRLDKNWRDVRYSRTVPFVFLKKITVPLAARISESLYEFPGFTLQRRISRSYPDTIAAHVLGYISEVSPNQIKDSKGVYKMGDYIGTTGLESTYEEHLRGEKGVEFLLKDNLGRVVGPYKNGSLDSMAVSGKNLICTLDADLQRYGEYLMQNKKGSIIAIEPATGEILTMISAPTYDPNLLSINNQRGKVYKELKESPLSPFFNRAVSAKYPPGSLFKSIVGLIAMEQGVWTANRGYSCAGGYRNGSLWMSCHGHPHPANMEIAIQHSCNAYFLHAFRQIIDKNGYYNPHPGLDTFVNYLHTFGLGNPLGIDIPGEKGGNVPTTETYDYMYPKDKGSWRSPTIVSLGIGQGEMELTTAQMANLAAILANRGYFYTPHLVRGFQKQGDTYVAPLKKEPNQIEIDKSYFEIVANGMEKVVLAGTARRAQVPGISVCGKTGTAENPHGKDHSIFFAFAPKEDPKIAIAVYIENGGFGGTYAAPIASLLIEKYLTQQIDPKRQWLEDGMAKANLIPLP